jgi:carbon monoxide dehydrogenase subunit G
MRPTATPSPGRAPAASPASADIDAPNGYTLTGQGTGGVAGFGKGEAKVSLAEDGDETVISYTAHATVGGKLAQIGQRLIDSTAKKLAGQFFSNFSDYLDQRGASGGGGSGS